jgi:alkaline phosphatase
MKGLTPADFQAKLDDSAAAFNEAIQSVNEWTSQRTTLLVTLAEHEVMHEGQIIRHMYALERELPESWVWA